MLWMMKIQDFEVSHACAGTFRDLARVDQRQRFCVGCGEAGQRFLELAQRLKRSHPEEVVGTAFAHSLRLLLLTFLANL